MPSAKLQSDPFDDERQPILFDALPVPPPKRSDRRAVSDIEQLIDLLAAAKKHPWDERMIGFQRRRIATLSKLLTPIEAAALNARFEAELERLGEPDDFWAEN